jgi:hypothetical protein
MCRRKKLHNLESLIFNSQSLSDYRKEILKIRYLRILWDFQNRCKFYSWIYHACRIMVTVGSLLVPAMMSIQYSKESLFSFTQSLEIPIYWATWAISLVVTIANGIFTLFKIDKKYYFLHSIYEKLQSEGYQYLSLTGKYSGILNKNRRQPTHDNQFIYFCHNIEKIKMSQVFEEFLKINDSSTPSNHINERQEPISNAVPSNVPGNMYNTIAMERLGSFAPRIVEPFSSGSSSVSGEHRPFDENIYNESLTAGPPTSPLQNIHHSELNNNLRVNRQISTNLSCINDSDDASRRTSVYSV